MGLHTVTVHGHGLTYFHPVSIEIYKMVGTFSTFSVDEATAADRLNSSAEETGGCF